MSGKAKLIANDAKQRKNKLRAMCGPALPAPPGSCPAAPVVRHLSNTFSRPRALDSAEKLREHLLTDSVLLVDCSPRRLRRGSRLCRHLTAAIGARVGTLEARQ